MLKEHALAYRNARIENIHTNKRFPGVIYADIRAADGTLLVGATLCSCYERMIIVADALATLNDEEK